MFRPTTRILLIFSLLVLLLNGCASASAPTPHAAAPEEQPSAPRGAIGETGSTVADSSQAAERIVIKNATLTIVVSDPPKSMDTIATLAEEMDGFVVSANLSQTELENGTEVPRADITIRVPVERLNEALDRIRAETNQPVRNENITSQDVTAEYTDLQSRLRNLENTEAQLTEIMDNANRTEDVLSVYNQLVQVREQIEVIKGQIQYYEQSAALSSISVNLLANEAVQPLTIGSWQPVGVAKNAVQALIDSMKFLANAAIWILIFVLPVLLVLYLVFFLPLSLLVRALRRRRIPRKPAAPPPQPTA